MRGSKHHAKTPTTRTASAPSAIAAGALAILARLLRVPGRGTPSSRLLLAAVATALATAALFAPAASADSQICEGGSGSGQCSEPSGVAVDREAALLFVADKGNNRVDVFDAESGDFLRAFGWGVADGATKALQVCVVGCHKGLAGSGDGQLDGPLGIAVDNDSGSAAFGDVYVYDGANPRVQRFHPNGEFVGKWGSAGKNAGQFESIRGIGVNSSGEVDVIDTWAVASGCAEPNGGKFEKRVQRFTPAGGVNANFKLNDARCGQVEAFAVSPEAGGEFYVANAAATGAVRKYASGGGSALATFNESPAEEASFSIAGLGVAAGGDVFVAGGGAEGEALGAERVATYTTAGEQTSVIYGEAQRPMAALAPFSGPLGGLFAVSREGGVFAIASLPAGPAVLPGTTRASGLDSTSVTLQAQLNPEGRPTTYRFEYVDKAHYEASGFAAATSTPQGGPVGPDFAPHAVAAPIEGLAHNTRYQMRLVAEDDQGHVTLGPARPFYTFGLTEFDVRFEDPAGEPATQAGSHPFAMSTALEFNNVEKQAEEAAKDVLATLPPGFVGNPTAVPQCETVDFLKGTTGCADSSAVGFVEVELAAASGSGTTKAPVYNLEPAAGVASKLGFWVANVVPVPIELGASPNAPYNIVGGPTNISQVTEVIGATLHVWGVPADERHNPQRGRCLSSSESCAAKVATKPFLTMPRSCSGPLPTAYAVDSWQHPGSYLPNRLPDLGDPNWIAGEVQSHDDVGNPLGLSGCGKLGFSVAISAQPTSRAASSATGLDFGLDAADNEGIANPDGYSNADLSKAVVTLPEGMTANPSSANGLGVCTEAQYEAESPYLAPGEGPYYTPADRRCPDASKLGTIEVETPVLEHRVVKGSLYLAKPYENPFGTLLALYMVLREPELGLVFRLPLKVEPDPQTGQLVTTSEEIPPYPFSHFRLHFREGARSPLTTPPGCGAHTVKAMLYPSSGGAPVESDSTFQIVAGPNGGACPSGEPFNPGFEAGTRNNAAGAYSPFDMRITRQDGEGDLSRFSAILPPGVVGKIAGIPWCPEAGIARAASRTGEHGGQEELDDPSCPAASQIGRTEAGAGVGSILTYVGGSLYLAGPYHGDPLSVVSITRLGPDPPHPQGDPAEPARPARLRRAARLHPQRDLMRTLADPRHPVGRRHRARPLGRDAGRRSRPLPGGELRQPRLQAEAGDQAEGRHQARRPPGAARRGHPEARPGQLRKGGGHPAALGLPRPGPHPHRLHPGAVRRRGGPRGRLPARLGLRACQGLDAAARPAARRAGVFALLQQQAARPDRRPARTVRPRAGRPDRLQEGRHPHRVHPDPRRPGLAVHLGHAGRQEGPDRQLAQPLPQAEAKQGEGQPARPERPQGHPEAGGPRGEVQEPPPAQADQARQEEEQAQEALRRQLGDRGAGARLRGAGPLGAARPPRGAARGDRVRGADQDRRDRRSLRGRRPRLRRGPAPQRPRGDRLRPGDGRGSLFVDTSAFYALTDDSDQAHARATELLAVEERLVTTDYVLLETWTLIDKRGGYAAAEAFWGSIRAGAATVEHIAPADLDAAWRIGEAFPDQAFSLADRTSFAVMERLGATPRRRLRRRLRRLPLRLAPRARLRGAALMSPTPAPGAPSASRSPAT
jgi:predicted nucleic acid-binding protein